MLIPIANPTDLLYTLEVALKHLPADAHPAHCRRLRELIERLEVAKEE